MMIGTYRSLTIAQKCKTLTGLLRWRGQCEPDRLAYHFLSGDGETPGDRITYGELDKRAQTIAATLQRLSARAERALLLYPPGFDYIAAFFGCLYAEVIAVPAYPPRANRNQRLQSMAADAQARFALTTNGILERSGRCSAPPSGLENLRWLATDQLADAHSHWREPETLDEDGLAYLQYTSGSTATPKGVMVSHRNVLHNSDYIHYGFAHTPESIALTWLPHFHDMGLVDGIIQPLYGGFPGLLMSPATFLQRPLNWLEAISRHRVTHSGGPNFAYDLCVSRIAAEQLTSLDLSNWRVAYNGAEPVRKQTLDRFAKAFAVCGFRPSSFYPAYGLAEATLKVCGGHPNDAPVICNLQASALEQNRIIEAATSDEDTRPLVSSGQAALETEVRIVHAETRVSCAPDEVGEIWVSGPGVTQGYWQRPEETEQTFRAYLPETGEGPFLRTGDLGFVKDGSLFVTGRLKELIIIRGRNHYPHDIELTVAQSHPSLRQGNGAAFSVEMGGEERLVIAQEAEPRRQTEWQPVIAGIREVVSEEFEIQPAAILLLKPGSIPKTSSGKVRRSAARAEFQRGDWEVLADWRANLSEEAGGLNAASRFESTGPASLESWLQERVAAMLRMAPVSVDVNCPLTRYGVDSLMSVELMHTIETNLGVVLPWPEFLQSSSLAQLAALTAEQLADASNAQRLASTPSASGRLTSTSENGWHPLSHNQKSLWFLHQVAPESTAYNISFAARIRGELDTEALRRAFDSVVSRHASLRTSFAPAEDEPVQRVHQQVELCFQVEEAGHWNEFELRERLSLEAAHSFDLEHPPLLRVFLFRRTASEHVLALVVHHIIVDFWSLSLMMHELGARYRAQIDGTPPVLNLHPLPYADYVDWQRAMLESAEGEGQQSFWQQELGGDLPVLDLPADYPRPAVQSYRGASCLLRLDPVLTSKLKSLAQLNDATLFMTLLAAFDVLLYRHTGQRELLVGSPASGRRSARLAHTVGYFVNPIVTRAQLSAGMSFTELLAQVRRRVLAAFAHQDYPFNLLVKQLQSERDPTRSPVFQVMFALQKTHEPEEQALSAFALGEAGAEMNLGGLRWESMALDQRVAQFDLSLTMAEVDGGLTASFEYCTELFAESTIRRLADHFQALLNGVVTDPTLSLAELPLLTRAESEQLLREWNDPEQVLPPVSWVHKLFERLAIERPDQTAVICAGEQLTYGQLNARANQLARHLRARGVGPNLVVGLCVERSVEMLVGLFGILKAGGAYVPLDPDYPQERLAFMLKDTGARWLLTEQGLSSVLPPTASQVILLDADAPVIERESQARLEVEIHADNLAYVIYTSGSTGVPKGIPISHASLANYIEAVTAELALTADDRILQFASLSFDVSAEEIFSCLTSGATLVLRDNEMGTSIGALLRGCREQELTVLNLPTAYWHQLSASLTPADWSQAETVRLVIIGSEKLQAERLAQWRSCVGPGVRLVDVYGPTETTIGATMCDLTGVTGAVNTGAKISIGRPIAHAQAYILDARRQPVPIGVAGELHIGGPGLSPGYLNRPALTAERFIPHPFSGVPGARLYRTGDLARFLPDGNIEFLGRLDGQVKVRGFRIELGEIERALVQHPRVRDAAVILRGERDEKKLIAYLVVDAAEGLATRDLRDYLKSRLPHYMMPSAFVFIASLPLNPNGKLDLGALPVPDYTRPELNTFVAPQTEPEQLLAHICADVLKLERVGLHDNFFELGGDSILTIQVVARAQQAGLNLAARQMFTHPTVAELAAVAGASPKVDAEQGQVAGEVPLTPIQRWFFAQEFEANDHWNMAVLLEVRNRLEPALLEQALSLLIAHHDALRLRFVRGPAGWRQFFTEAIEDELRLSRVDLSAVAEEEQPSAMETIAAKTQAELSLSAGPLLRAVLFEPGGSRAQRLLLVVHHLVIDGISWVILLEDLARAYLQLQAGDRVELPSKTTSFKSWAEHMEERARFPGAQDTPAYWTSLAAREFKSLPLDYPGGTNAEASTQIVSVMLTVEETRSLLQEVPAAYHTQINDVLLAALVGAFEQWTGESELLLELESHGREEGFAGVNLSRTVGWFTNAFPVLLKLDGKFTPGKSLQSIKEQLRAIPDHGINHGLLRYPNAAPESASPGCSWPKPEVTFNYLGQLDQMLKSASIFALKREPCGPTRDGRNHRTHLLEVDAGVYGGELRLDWSYSAELHCHETIERLAANHAKLLREIIEHCLSPGVGGYSPSDFPLAQLDQQGLDALLKTIGPVADIYPLSAMQEGMLFHSLDRSATSLYIEQLSCTLDLELNVRAFAQAWEHIAARHEILRTAFIWENVNQPLQVVQSEVSILLEEQDWRGFAPAEQERLLGSFLCEDRRRTFELSQAPLMRLALLRMADESYRFIWTHHHVLLDGWSVALLLREVLKTYETICRGEELPTRRQRRFRDYIAWLRQQDVPGAENFWRAELKGFTRPTVLTAGWPESSPVDEQEKGASQEVRLSAEETAALQAFARQHHVTLSTLVHGAFALLLSRYTMEDDVVFGTTVSGRPPALAGVDSMVGLFINTLPVRAQASPSSSTLSWLKGLQAKLVSLRDYEYSSLVDVQAWSDLPRRQALFESLLVFENYPVDAALVEQNGNLKLGHLRNFERTNYPLTIAVFPGPELLLQGLHATDRFDGATIARLLEHLRNLMLDIMKSPDKTLIELQLLSEEEHGLVAKWNDTARAYPSQRVIHQMFEERAARCAETLAVVGEDRQLSFYELNRQANQLARHLQRWGVGPDVPVALCVERSPEMIVALLGILKAGGAYVPLDPSYPAERLCFMVQDTGGPVLLTQQSLSDLFAPLQQQTRIVNLDSESELIAEENSDNLPNLVSEDNVAYIIYTSGSTGLPKGVAVSHAAVLNLIEWYKVFKVHPGDRGTYVAGVGFDASVMELWPNLTAGVGLCLPDEETRLSPERMRDWLIAQQVNICFLPTPLAEMALELDWPSPSALRVMITGGDKLRRFPDPSVGFELVNVYGPTETTVLATTENVKVGGNGNEPAIGKPIVNVKVHLLDQHLRPIPVGVAGELYVAGAGLARGYWKRPGLTAERFIPDPASSMPGARLYRTGDLARYFPDGTIEFLGRVDNQIKIRGLRIELGEIEAVLSAHETVRAAVVLAREDTPGEKRLAAYLVAAGEEHPLRFDELRGYLRKRLPEYMIPSAFVVLETFPLTPNGKVDRRALPAPDRTPPQSDTAFAAPRSPVEEALVDIWREVIGLDRIGIHDNFFELGGHSLLATRVLSKVRAIFRTELPLRVIFECGTIADLALAIVAFEPQPGQTEKIARVLQKVKSLPAEDLSKELQRKRRKRDSR